MVRALGKRHYDVQLMGGIVLHHAAIAEMRTGEGKTFVAPLAAFLNALVGRGSHVVTTNDYLAKRDAQLIGAIFHRLGMSVGSIQHEGAFVYDPDFPATDERLRELRPVTRREAYAADVTYGTNNEFGFDFLRDNLVVDLAARAQRPHFFAVVDEVDNILIDEARTPLIISGNAEESADKYLQFAGLVPRLKAEEDYVVDEKFKQVAITEAGTDKMEKWLGVENMFADDFSLARHLEQALKAQVLYQRDRDYVIKDGEVIIVDEFTGRLMPGRRWSEGLHQAVEAKEGVAVRNEQRTLATVTFQNYFRMYDKLSGMTGTAETEAEEFSKIYDLEVVVIPTHREMIRADYADLIYAKQSGKWNAVIDEIVEEHEKGRPVLVGTISVEVSETLGEMLKRRGVKHSVLNAKLHEREAEIVAQAGRSRSSDHRHEHGGPRHRHPARRQSRGAGRRKPPQARDEHPRGDAGAIRRGARRGRAALRGGQGEGSCRRRHAHPRDGAPRGAPHRQPAARPRRPPGRPGKLAVLPEPRGRPDAPLRQRPGPGHHEDPRLQR